MGILTPFMDHLREFARSVHGFPIPPFDFLRRQDGAVTATNIDAVSALGAVAHRRDILSWQTRQARISRDSKYKSLEVLARHTTDSVISNGLPSSLSRYSIAMGPSLMTPLEADIIQIKINHGYWEQYLTVVYGGYDGRVMRAPSRQGNLDAYFAPYFIDALDCLFARAGVVNANTRSLSFPGHFLGMSLGNGDETHDEYARKLNTMQGDALKIAHSVVIATITQFESLFGAAHFVLNDGAFPKASLRDGVLPKVLNRTATDADEILFIVPPHLSGVRLRSVPAAKQRTLLIPGTAIHQSWLFSLQRCGERVYESIARGATVMIVTQAAVFAAMLGLYLKRMKDDLGLTGRLYYFDLGQVLDLAAPAAGGPWVKTWIARQPATQETEFIYIAD